jgi:lipopolysaccharide/colanic/teichoic acid biosynthesis glycosyltransferase
MTSTRLPKRLFDLAGALAGLLAFSPVMAVISLAIVLEDGWPVLFRQARLGQRRSRSPSSSSARCEMDGSRS